MHARTHDEPRRRPSASCARPSPRSPTASVPALASRGRAGCSTRSRSGASARPSPRSLRGSRNPSLRLPAPRSQLARQAGDALARSQADVRRARRPDEPRRTRPAAPRLPPQHQRRHHDAQPARVPRGAGRREPAGRGRRQRLVAVHGRRSSCTWPTIAARAPSSSRPTSGTSSSRPRSEPARTSPTRDFIAVGGDVAGLQPLRGRFARGARAPTLRSRRGSRKRRRSSSTPRAPRASPRARCASSRRKRCTPRCSSSPRRRCACDDVHLVTAPSTTRRRSASSP